MSPRSSGSRPALPAHLVGGLPGAGDHLADAPHRLRVGAHHRDRARGRAGCPRPRWSRRGSGSPRRRRPRGCDGSRWWQTMSMSRCSSSVFTVNGRVGFVEEGRTFGSPHDADDVRRVPAAGPLGVEGVDGAPGERRDGVLGAAGLVERVGVDGDLDVVLVRDPQAGVDRGRGGAPVLVELEADRARRGSARRAPPARRRSPCRGARCSAAARRSPAA